MALFIQKSLRSSSEMLQSMLAAGPRQFLDETGSVDEVVEPLLILTSSRGPQNSPCCCLASLLMKS